ncbi:MAG: ArsJ-associated glyceraldehyde-3-phosphate dehydrogenase [Verrucomicrobiota bacterium]
MSVRVGINGFGRIGRLAFRVSCDSPELDFVVINDPGGVEAAAHLLEFDSVQGRWDREVTAEGGALCFARQCIPVTSERSPAAGKWSDFQVDVVIEASGKFKTPEDLQPYFDAGVKKVVVAAPVKSGALNVVMGVNDHLYDPAEHHIVTAASCTTNCLAPVVKVVKEQLGIAHGSMTTIHDITNTQVIVDRPHKDLRRARAASMSLIPTTTGSAKAITQIYPELAGRLNGHAVRVPLLTGSLTDCVFEVEQETTADEVNGWFAAASEGSLKGILGYETRPLVGVDYQGDPRSSIVDGLSTLVVDGTHLKIYAWYDNEYGYSNRLAELVKKVAIAG